MAETQHLLLVDDSRVARLTLKHLLKETGLALRITEAGNAEEALALFEQGERFDTAMLDYNMPGDDGVELAAKIKNYQPDLKMILVTANIQDAVIERAKAMGMGFIGKPADMDHLKTALTQEG